ncbi:MAG: AAA family ATPase [Actinomycetota bacterium]
MKGLVAFVGRGRELARFQRALAGDARMLLVVGDAGVGKTRFVGEGIRQASQDGTVSVWGGCLPLTEKLPLMPVAEALGELSMLQGGRLLETALGMIAPYARTELARLLPQLGSGDADPGGPVGGWQRERLFSAVADVLAAVARQCPVGLVVEDVHWADSATLDFLTFLTAATRDAAGLTVVVTCRGDEAPVEAHVAAWLAHVAGSSVVHEIRLGPLSRSEVTEQITGLTGGPPSADVAGDVYARGEGNPFFTEQLVAAALADPAGNRCDVPSGLPVRLAELLLARAERCSGPARQVLAAFAVAGRPLSEAMLGDIAGLDLDAVRAGLRELVVARLLADSVTGGAPRPRHMLLAEAVAADLLPGERLVLHERIARVLQAAGGPLAAEAAGHWAAAGRAAEELPARVLAARAAERVFAFAEAAAHWQRAVLLWPETDTGATGELDLPGLYVRAIDALEVAGDTGRAGALAEDAYRRFASHPDPAIAAAIHLRAAAFRMIEEPAAALPLLEDAITLAGQSPLSAGHAGAWLRYGQVFLHTGVGDREASRTALNRALEIAEACDATALIAQCLICLSDHAFASGDLPQGFALLSRARTLAEASDDGQTIVWLAAVESMALANTGKLQACLDTALRGLMAARQTGHQDSADVGYLVNNAAVGLTWAGRTAEAAALIDPLTSGRPDRDHWEAHVCRASIDVLRGDLEAAGRRFQQISAIISRFGSFGWDIGTAEAAADLALWRGRPDEALGIVKPALVSFKPPDLAFYCASMLTVGIRACADLADMARARRDEPAVSAALAAANDLASWADSQTVSPLADHPYSAQIPADRATWDAERTRLAGASDPAAWATAARAWENLGRPHSAGYAWWRNAEAQLAAGQPRLAAEALRTAAVAAAGHEPLLTQIRTLAQRARIPLGTPGTVPSAGHPADQPAPYRLTDRELAVLRLLTAGRTNAQIGAELYISPKTASVHVTSILRKLGVTSRVQAAARAERAGMIDNQEP